jgi:hypothetical protein
MDQPGKEEATIISPKLFIQIKKTMEASFAKESQITKSSFEETFLLCKEARETYQY